MSKITKISALEILDSRGNWTLETSLVLDGEFCGVASVPSGASVGSYEKKAVPAKTAVAAINGLLGPRLMMEEFVSQEDLDQFLVSFDSSIDRSSLGANTMLSVSLAFCKAQAAQAKLPLYSFINKAFEGKEDLKIPQPIFNIINGGRHAQNDLDFQEFIVIPRDEGPFSSCLIQADLIFHTLGKLLEENGFSTELGDEGGYAPHNISYEGVLNFMMSACKKNNLEPGKKVFFGLDAAASTLTLGDVYNLERAGLKLDFEGLAKLYEDLAHRYPIIYLEDPFGQDNFSQFKALKRKFLGKVEVVGDDLITTNTDRLEKALQEDAINAVIVKPNQIGTLTETLCLIDLAKKSHLAVVTSHRSAETDDSFIADLSVAVGSTYIKAGAPARGERVAKYNRLLEIEQELSFS